MANYEDTYGKLVDLQHMMGTMRYRHAKKSGPLADTSRGRGRVLALLKMHDGLSTRDMANVLDIRVSSLNETLARMEAEGLVERRQSEEDGRIMLIFLTDEGRSAEQPELDLPRQLLFEFTDEELHTLDGYLDRMITKLEAELGEDWREHEEHMQQRREQIFHKAGRHDGGHDHGSRDGYRKDHRDDSRGGDRGQRGGYRGGRGDRRDARFDGKRGGYRGRDNGFGDGRGSRGDGHGGRGGFKGNGFAGRGGSGRQNDR